MILSFPLQASAYTCVVSAVCESVDLHKFGWAASRKVEHSTNEKSVVYALNAAIPAAIVTCGNNFSRLSRLAQVRLGCIMHAHQFRVFQCNLLLQPPTLYTSYFISAGGEFAIRQLDPLLPVPTWRRNSGGGSLLENRPADDQRRT